MMTQLHKATIDPTAKVPSSNCTCDTETGLCCETAALLLRRIRYEFSFAIVSGEWESFNRARTQLENHRLNARRLECDM